MEHLLTVLRHFKFGVVVILLYLLLFQLYAFGYNGTSNLGIGNTVNQYNPTKVHFPASVFIRKVRVFILLTKLLDDKVFDNYKLVSYLIYFRLCAVLLIHWPLVRAI